MNIIHRLSFEIVDNPKRLLEEMRANSIIHVDDLGYTITPTGFTTIISPLVPVSDERDYDETQDMASLRTERTGVDNTVFVSPKGRAKHAPRIKIAVDPPTTFDPTAQTASMAIHDYTVGGELPTHINKQARRFIELNRDACFCTGTTRSIPTNCLGG